MAIEALGNNFQMVPFAGNPVQNFGAISTLAIAAVAIHTMSNLPQAEARDAGAGRKTCEVLCAPLPGEKADAPEKACVEACYKSGAGDKVEQEMMGKASYLANGFDCLALCGDSRTGFSKLVTDTVFIDRSLLKTSAKAVCVATSFINSWLCGVICVCWGG